MCKCLHIEARRIGYIHIVAIATDNNENVSSRPSTGWKVYNHGSTMISDIDDIIIETQRTASRHRKPWKWIPFEKFEDIKYLSKGGFGEIYKTTWIYGGYNYYRKRYDENITTIQSDDKIAKNIY